MKTIDVRKSSKGIGAWYAKLKLPFKLLPVFVLLPTLCVAAFMCFFQSRMYVSDSMFAVRTQDATRVQDSSGSSIMALFRSASPLSADSFVLKNYIHSVELFDKVDAKLHIVAHYSDKSRDVISRLRQNPTQQERLDYWKRTVEVGLDPDTGILTLSVRAYTAEMSHDINKAVLELCEDMVNQMNNRAWQDAVGQAEREVKRANERMAAAQAAMQKYRDAKGILDPVLSAKTYESVAAALEGEVAKTKAELAEALSYMRPDSPKVSALRAHLRALEGQMSQQRGRMAGATPESDKLSGVVGDYQSLAAEVDFAQKQQITAMTLLEQARVSLQLKSRYVVSFVEPNLPDVPTEPRPLYDTLQTFGVLLLIYAMSVLIIASIREHAGF